MCFKRYSVHGGTFFVAPSGGEGSRMTNQATVTYGSCPVNCQLSTVNNSFIQLHSFTFHSSETSLCFLV